MLERDQETDQFLKSPAMEGFHGPRLVRLRCRARPSMYLVAMDDKTGVCLRRGRSDAANLLWAQSAAAPNGFLLCGCYGLFLGSSGHPSGVGPPDAVEAHQRTLGDHSAPPPDVLWQAVRAPSDDGFLVRNLGGGFLRANGRYRWWRRTTDVTVAPEDRSVMLVWDVEVLPVEKEPFLVLSRPPRKKGLLQSVQASLKEEQRLLRSILTEIHSEELKKSKSNMKMKRAEKKLRALMDEEQKAQEKRGTHYFLSRWEATAVQITSKACMCHAIKAAESQARISELESLKADKELRIQQLKWQRSHLKT